MKQKKWYRPANILWCIAVILLLYSIAGNAIHLATYPPQIREAEVRAGSLSSELDEVTVQIAQREEELALLEAEIDALPTPGPTPVPKPDPDDYDTTITYEQIKRNPQNYMGKKAAFLGSVSFEIESSWQ